MPVITVKVLNLIHVANATHTPCVFLGTDAEKAFNRVNWSFRFLVLCHDGFGETMIKWISKIYSDPSAQVKANGVLSNSFPITNGTWQGCPLSLSFLRSLEPFLCKICLKLDIMGLTIGGVQHKVSAYADE